MQFQEKPLISVIVPIYNVEFYVEKCIESIINQKYTNLEIILVDDASDVQCRSIVDSYVNKDKRIKLVRHSFKKGSAAARNSGLNIANGDFITFVDGDDWISEIMISQLYEELCLYNADISVCGYDCIDKNGYLSYPREHGHGYKIGNEELVLNHDIFVLSGAKEIMRYCVIQQDCLAWNKMYKSFLFRDVRYPNKDGEDLFITYRIMEKAKRIVIDPTPTYKHVSRDNSITNQKFSLARIDWVEAAVQNTEYISVNYPEMFSLSFKFAYSQLLWTLQYSIQCGVYLEYKTEINNLIDRLRVYRDFDAHLSVYDKHLVDVMFNDIPRLQKVSQRVNHIKNNSLNL